MKVCASDFRKRMKMYMDLLSSGNEKFIKVTRQRGCDVYVLPEDFLSTMSPMELRELQKETRLKAYYSKITEM